MCLLDRMRQLSTSGIDALGMVRQCERHLTLLHQGIPKNSFHGIFLAAKRKCDILFAHYAVRDVIPLLKKRLEESE